MCPKTAFNLERKAVKQKNQCQNADTDKRNNANTKIAKFTHSQYSVLMTALLCLY